MSATDLFPDMEPSLSPRLKWMKLNGIVTYCSLPDEPEFKQWMATFWQFADDYAVLEDQPRTQETAEWFLLLETGSNGETRTGIGSTEDEALADLCAKAHLKLWNEEEAR